MPGNSSINKIKQLDKNPFVSGRNRGREHNYSFLLRFVVLSWLVFLLTACGATSVETEFPDQNLSQDNTTFQEDTAEVNDRACAYFYFLWGKTAENHQRYEEAQEAYEKALLCDEETQYLKRSLAIIFIKMNRREQAVEILRQIISNNPGDTENRVLLAKVYSSMGRNDDAVAVYRELLTIKEDHDTLLMLGTLYAQNKEYEKAREILNRLISLEGDSAMAYYYLARLYREMQDYDKAAAAYEKALEINWFERLAYEVAEFYEDRQEYEKAIVIYRKIVDRGESSDMAKTRLVNLYLTLGKNDKALELLRQLRSVLPESHNVDITISRIFLSQEKYDEAIMILEDVLKTNPELITVRYLLGMAYYRNNNDQKALEQLQSIPAESDLYEDSVLLRIRIMVQSDDLQGAIGLLQEQIDSDATRKPDFYILLASLYRQEEDIDQARKIYEQAMEIYPDDIELLYNYGIFLEKIGEQAAAMARMKQVLALDPENGPALNYVGFTWADNNVHLEEALQYIKKAVELLPEDGYVRDSLGWVYYKLGNIRQAIIELERASEMVDSDPVIKEHLGDVYLRTGQYKKARTAYEEAYRLYEEETKKNSVREKINAILSGSAK